MKVGYIVLLAVGGVMGWLASILSRRDDIAAVATNVLAGSAGSLAIGIMLSREPLMNGLTATTLLAGTAGAIAVLAGLAFLRLRLVR